MAKRALTEDQVKKICGFYQAGMTSTKLAEDFDVSPATITRWLKKSGITMRESRESLADPINDRFFQIIDSEVKAYWLGFFVADGCLAKSVKTYRQIRFYLSSKDKDAVFQFAKDLEYEGKVRHDKKKKQHGLAFNNPYIGQDLINLQALAWKKGSNTDLLQNIPEKLVHHFIRGFFDGDGCIGVQKREDRPGLYMYANFCGPIQDAFALEAIQNIIPMWPNLGAKQRNSDGHEYSEIKLTGNQQVNAFGNWLYRDATRFLARKKNRFVALKQSLSGNQFGQIELREIIDKKEHIDFYSEYHYLGAAPRHGFTLGGYLNGELIAAGTIGAVVRNEIAKKQGLHASEVKELARLCIHPEFQWKNLATWFMSRMIKHFKVKNRKVKLLVSFADQTQGHEGTIYKAGNWRYDGETGRSYHYENDEGRVLHKKTVYDQAKKLGMKEREYMDQMSLRRIYHLPKKRYLLSLKRGKQN